MSVSRASAPGRVCLAGEDIDWISGPAIVCAISLRVTVTVAELPQSYDHVLLRSSSPLNTQRSVSLADVGKYNQHPLDYVQAALQVVSRQGVNLRPLVIDVSSSLPAAAGLSSSAAVSLASVAALSDYFGLRMSTEDLCALACMVEIQELQTGAGQMDFYSCGLGGVMYLNCATTPPSSFEKHQLPSDLRMVLADTETSHNTGEVIRLKRLRYAALEPAIMAYIEHTEAAIEQLRNLLANNRGGSGAADSPFVQELGRLVSSCHLYLRDFMQVSTTLLDECVEASLRGGAVGAKLTGTGMGGCMFALVPQARVEGVLQALSKFPVRICVTGPSQEGLIIG